ncbi:hypothetical protein AZH53_09835 [Methanomicrobiaceae archaeon CYW5]|nr:hypothetical protein [Methanovulcanius yangii]
MNKIKKIHAMLFAIERDPGIGKTKLMKYIFFIDLIHFNQRGVKLFESSYIRMPNGPVDGGALSLASESNRFFDVSYPRSGAGNQTYEQYHFDLKMEPDLSLFTVYERMLLVMVLQALKGRTATTISSLTHQLRLWKEFTDGDEIPTDSLELSEEEIRLLEQYGFHIDGFQRRFCRSMLDLSRGIHDAVSPLNEERITMVENFLDDLLRDYPHPSMDIFHDAYLAWDDTFRTALIYNPVSTLSLTEDCCDAICYVSYALAAKPGRTADITSYCEKVEERFNSIGEDIYRGLPVREPPEEMISSLLDDTMRLSRSMAQHPSTIARR